MKCKQALQPPKWGRPCKQLPRPLRSANFNMYQKYMPTKKSGKHSHVHCGARQGIEEKQHTLGSVLVTFLCCDKTPRLKATYGRICLYSFIREESTMAGGELVAFP